MHEAAMDMFMESNEQEEKVSITTRPPCPPLKVKFDSQFYSDIMEQPEALRTCLKGRYSLSPKPSITFETIDSKILRKISDAHRVIICACGTSHNSALVGEYAIEQIARIPTKAEYASEFRYKHDRLNKDKDIFIAISQSGETADTLAALRSAKSQGVLTIGIVNEEKSAIHNEADYMIPLRVGEEMGIASTKTFTSSMLVLVLLALRLAQIRGEIEDKELSEVLRAVEKVPELMKNVLSKSGGRVHHAARVFRYSKNFLFLGRGFNFPIAMEGALKLKEISNTHAEGYPAAEMKHGPIALIDTFMPVLFIAPRSDSTYEKIKSNIQEVLARRGAVLIITEEDNPDFKDIEYVFRVPSTLEYLFPILAVLPLQLLSMHIATMRSLNVDHPTSGLRRKHTLSPSLGAKTPGVDHPPHVRTDTDLNMLKI